MTGGLDSFSMRELYRIEAKTQTEALVAGLLALEASPTQADQLEACMRAAHSLKGAARLVDIGAGVIAAHSMEEVFVAAQAGRIVLDRGHIDLLLEGVDLISAIADATGLDDDSKIDELELVAERYSASLREGPPAEPRPKKARPVAEPAATLTPEPAPGEPEVKAAPAAASSQAAPAQVSDAERAMRVSADNFNRLLDLAGESLIESRRLGPLARSFQRLKHLQRHATRALDDLRDSLPQDAWDTKSEAAFSATEQAMLACREFLVERLAELEAVDRQASALAHRLYDQALMVRMRPFADGLTAFPRMVRDIAHSLGKQANLEIIGATTQVDRDILERLEAPLGHLLRNAVDHGIEDPVSRISGGKPVEGTIRIEAHHSAGMLQILVSDDGAGVDLERIRAQVVARNHAEADTAERLSEAELLEFLFLPGFTLKSEVSELSGRGVGLDVVRDMVKQVGGTVNISTQPGAGTRFQLQLPLTLSVIRALLVEIAGEPYAFSFGQVLRATKIDRSAVEATEGHQFFDLDGAKVGLVSARQVLGSEAAEPNDEPLSVVVLGGPDAMYGVVVDSFLGARELVVQPLDQRLGKIKDISAGALMEDGTPLLIIDAEDMVRSMEKLASSGRLTLVKQATAEGVVSSQRKRVLVVDDSFTVRELQRKLLSHHGYDVELAVDGMEGWNVVRGGGFDLVVTDVDMPRMDGIELTGLIKGDARLQDTPVMILSYKDREDDRRRGLDAGADYYLTKGSYQSDALIEAVVDLIGSAQ